MKALEFVLSVSVLTVASLSLGLGFNPPLEGGSDWPQWGPVFDGVLAGRSLYLPGFGGTICKLNRISGTVMTRINPFGEKVDGAIFVAGPLSADDAGNIYYNAIQLDPVQPWEKDVVN